MRTELPKRFTDAVTKLYNAFHENRLNAMDGCECAVGNLCNNTNNWLNSYEDEMSVNTGYSSEELITIELLFMYGIKSFLDAELWEPKDVIPENKETVFNALSAVIEYLCELDNIPNIMEYKSLFETENKLELTEVL